MSSYWDVLTSAQAVVQGLNLTGVLTEQVRVRKKPVYLAEHDTLPLVVLSPQQEGVEQLAFGNYGVFVFPVLVTVIQESALRWEDLQWLLEARESIRRALHKTALGSTSVFDCDYDPAPVYDAAALNAGFDVSTMAFAFKTQEDRSE